jgi:hypothetical protein
MSAPQASFIPLLIVAMVTWKISYSKKTSKFTGASQSMRSASSRSFNNNKNIKSEPTSSAISERLYARSKSSLLLIFQLAQLRWMDLMLTIPQM